MITDVAANSVLECLRGLAEGKYRQFQSSLLPGTEGILGVRLPVLRRIARDICRADWRAFLAGGPSDVFEMAMLRGFVVAGADMPFEDRMAKIEAFLPEIDNWAVCDSFCTSLRFKTAAERHTMFLLVDSQSRSVEEYRQRFAAVMLQRHFVSDEYAQRAMDILASINCNGYYSQMGVAWALSIFYTKYPDAALAAIDMCEGCVQRMAVRKIFESRLTTQEQRDALKAKYRK